MIYLNRDNTLKKSPLNWGLNFIYLNKSIIMVCSNCDSSISTSLWLMLNTGSAGADMVLVKDIYLYAKGKITQLQTATRAQIEAYDPVTDIGWPT